MTSTLKKLFAVSDIHIGTQGTAHAKPRIEAMLSAAWAQMQRDQKEAFLRSEAVRQFIQIPGDTFESLDVDALVTSMNQEELDRQGTIAPELLTPSIDAEVHDDGHQITAHFDAAAWFAQASEEDLWKLYSCGWARDYTADAVAEFYEDRDEGVKQMFELVRISQKTRNPVGFECCIESDQAMAWLEIHRKPLWARILCDQHGVKLSQSQDESSLSRWDWLTDTNEGSEISFDTKDEAALNAVETLGLTAD